MSSTEEEPESKRQRLELEAELEIQDDEADFDLDMFDTDSEALPMPCSGDSDSKDPLNMNSFVFDILSLDEVYREMNRMVSNAHDVLENVPISTIRTMLNHVKWNKDRLVSEYFADEAKFMAEAKILLGPTSSVSAMDGIRECALCSEPMNDNSFGLSCGDRYCNSCWTEYLTYEIMEKGAGQTITCPGCHIIVEDLDVEQLVTDPIVRSRYKVLICTNFIESSKKMRWCPKPGCSNAVSVEVAVWGKVECRCGHAFCFGCGLDWHEPINCVDLKRWMDKLAKDTGNSTWMLKNTKDCPECGTMIEKNGGCNHMTCRKCKGHFCWNCGQKWSSHEANSGYTCNRFYDPQLANPNASDLRHSVQRFNHFHTRYVNHAQSLKFETRLDLGLTLTRNDYEKNHGMAWTEVQFLHEALDVLVNCRKTLMSTYAFAYFLDSTPMSEIFDSNQSDLERETEVLSQYLEIDINSNKFTPQENRARITDKSNYCDQRRTVLVQHVYEGYAEDTWTFI